ncbi:MAG TPA: aldolase/citrate lyase family protein [Planctomicrobium sp.]|nr:aldolase/citrate lyase family protein [Planctomicrobium sp.]
MRTSRIKSKLDRNEPVLITALHFFDPSIYELASLLGMDGLWLDLEHHATSVETAASLIRAARVGTADVVARPAKGEFMRMARLLEAGAQGIMYPRCSHADEARELVRWAKFFPLGERGVDGANGDMPYGMGNLAEYLERANRETFLVAQLEDHLAIEQADEIAAVPGIDVLFFGVGDFSVSSGIPGQFDHPNVMEAMKKVAAAAHRHGKVWGTPSFNVTHAEQLLELGARFLSGLSDLSIIRQGLERQQREYAQLGFMFKEAGVSVGNRNGHPVNSLVANK